MANHAYTPHLSSRDAILDAGLRCFSKYGYEATSLRLLSIEAGKNSSLVGYYFGSKEGLYREVIQQLFAQLANQSYIEKDKIGEQATTGILECPKLTNLITHILSSINLTDEQSKIAARLWLTVISTPKPESIDLIKNQLTPLLNDIRSCVKELCPQCDDPSVDFWSFVILCSCLGQALMAETCRLLWGRIDEWSDPTTTAKRISTLFSFGLRHHGPEVDLVTANASTGAQQ